ncbi:uncharacterized protein BX663DRAFT_514409 [Cokeromyces recurvatus]|uniref:uncharacterized protein n=1 Tax=Cokeromyces recurvatus TaxID=90255 RepID=UPI00221FF1B4|nr:uncharacterized protein BX663DRAFT_514409 [Cokeromyces recurvatus]KAI7901439.1 hypothetical protein BX663DRAFT_514409 [Cokeromyces recurvatus]
MLQEYPTQIQPKSSSTRGTQDSLQQESDTSTNKVDAEASRILIDLANQGTNDNTHNVIMSNKIHNKAKVKKHSYQLQSDPIMLLAAAAAVIDKESNNKDDYKGGSRVYERREIQLNSRQQGSLKRKSYTYGVNSNSKSSLFQHRRHSEKRHYYQRGSISTQDNTWSPLRKDEEVVVVEGAKGSSHNKTTTTFSWQFLSMKQNPRIKRNAMHAYITYMIYTDMAQEQQRRSMVYMIKY